MQLTEKEQEALDVIDAINKSDNNVEIANQLAQKLDISPRYAYHRIRVLRLKGYLDENDDVVKHPKQNPSEVQNNAINKDEVVEPGETPIVDVIPCDVDLVSLVPNADPHYKYRNGVDDIIKRYAKRNQPLFLIGEAGSGKTHACRQYAADEKLPFLRVACDDSSVLKEFIGKREIINGSTIFRMGLLIELVQKPSVILFDEFNALPAARLFFLHELLDNRTLYIKDAGSGLVINVHPQCKIFLACNPNNSKYSGTNKVNVALADRGSYLSVPNFEPDDVAELFDCGSEDKTQSLKKFYKDVHKVITEQNLRIAFSLRSVQRISDAIKSGDSIEDALQFGFYNGALLTATDRERDSLRDIARVHFGRNQFKQSKRNREEY